MAPGNEAGTAKLEYEGKMVELPVFEGSEGEKALDIRALRSQTGMITYDPGFGNTGACESNITFIDGEKGVLRIRGYEIDDLAEHCEFVEVAYLLVNGNLPNPAQRASFSEMLTRASLIHEDMRNFFRQYPEHAHPMAILSACVVSLSTFYPELERSEDEEINVQTTRLISKIRTISAFSYKKFIGQPFVYPRYDLKYCENFLNMMFSSPVHPYELNPVVVKAINQFFILHADHEQNCSTTVVRLVGSSRANLYASIASGVCALWGPLHGGANQAVVEMLEEMQREGWTAADVIAKAKNKESGFRLMGFGHRVYKTYDPRARIAKEACEKVLKQLGVVDPLLDLAFELEDAALNDDYFKERNLYPNVDFYTGITLRAVGIPTNMYPVMFAIGRLPGWIAQWRELWGDPDQRIGRPRQIYTGPVKRDFIPISERG
ncbi:MAG: citrate synthase [Verrucomicrobia bacterium]|nr:citrate synthase [Verrucomicrobiota bacterium]